MKKVTKAYAKNSRLAAPHGRKGIPPETANAGGETYILITNDLSVKQAIDKLLDSNSAALPQ